MSDIHYWTFKHKPGSEADEIRSKDFVLQAVRDNYAFMQYEYGLQKNKMVTQNWNRMLEIKEGDVIFLRGDERIYAFGHAIRPRLKPNITLEAKKIIKDNDESYNSSNYRGVIHFIDSDVFYENLDENENWGQRIDVDSWQCYFAEGIPAKSQDLYKDGENEFGVLKEIKPEKGLELIENLYRFTGMRGNLLTLLKNNYNIILTGAPGTGKTYLAKQIACLMLFGKNCEEELNENEQKQFFEQCGFVQFHPSYDYTDFVEGLRPFNDDNSSIGFERKDGVFKEFCAKALKNLMDSKKDKKAVKADEIFEIVYNSLLNDIEDGVISTYNTKRGGDLLVYISTKNQIVFTTKTNKKKYVRADYLKALFNDVKDDNLDLDNITKEELDERVAKTTPISHVDHIQYRWTLKQLVLRYKKLKKEIVNTEVQEIKQKNYVFIIDEINRGEISKIFGELFFSIDPGYRGKHGKVQTQYATMQNEPNEFDEALGIGKSEECGCFFVPENVYIIGTMNDIDRSVESMDFAFRRRFAFKEITAKDSQKMLDSDEAWGKDEKGHSRKPSEEVIMLIKEKMDALNNMICPEKKDGGSEKGIEGLSSAYHIGASYFLKLANYKKGDGTYNYDQLWDNHLEGLILEYMRGMTDVPEKIKKLAIAFGYSKMEKYE